MACSPGGSGSKKTHQPWLPAGKFPDPCSPFGVVGGINILNYSEENSVTLTGGVIYSGVPGGIFIGGLDGKIISYTERER
jgi:hypothetical protein